MDPNKLEFIHEKALGKNDIKGTLALPVRLMESVWAPNDLPQKDFQVVDQLGASFYFKGRLRFDPSNHPKPEVYGSEWKRFVLSKGLRKGDVLVFNHHPEPASSQAVFVLTIKREIRLGGATFSGHIDP